MTLVTFINALRVLPEREAEFLEKWDREAASVRAQPGLIRTSLHRNLNPEAPFQFFTIAAWESPAAFAAATFTEWCQRYVADFGFSAEAGGFAASPALCEVVRTAPPFESTPS